MADPLVAFVKRHKQRFEAVQSRDWTPPPEPDFGEQRHDTTLHYRKASLPDARGKPLGLSRMRNEMTYRLKQYLGDPADERMMLVNIMAGGGKTTAAARVAQWATEHLGYRILWAAPRHNSFDDLRNVTGFNPAMWYHWQPIADTAELTTCRYADEQAAWAQKGYRTMPLCRALCQLDGHIKVCPYRCQKKQKEPIIFGMHQHLVHGLAIRHFDAVVVDELPLQVFVQDRVIRAKDLEVPGLSGPVRDLVNVLIGLVSAGKRVRGKGLYDQIGPILSDVYAQVEIMEDVFPAEPLVTAPSDVYNAPTYYIPGLLAEALTGWKAWDAGWESWLERVWVDSAGLHILSRRNPWRHLPTKMIVLDATADEDAYRHMFPERGVYRYAPEVERVGRIYQVTGRLHGKGSMVAGGDDLTTRQAGEAVAIVKHVASLPHMGQVGVITHKGARASFEALLGEEWVGHFYGLRGSNALEQVDTLFVIGTPSPRVQDIIRIATALEDERARPYGKEDEDGRYVFPSCHEDRPYAITRAFHKRIGGRVPHRSIRGFWNDATLQAIAAQLREAEIVQAIHRSRVNVRECTVWLLTSTPTNERLDGVWDDMPREAGFCHWLQVDPDDVRKVGIYWKRWLQLWPRFAEWRGATNVPLTSFESWLADAADVSKKWAENDRWGFAAVEYFELTGQLRRVYTGRRDWKKHHRLHFSDVFPAPGAPVMEGDGHKTKAA